LCMPFDHPMDAARAPVGLGRSRRPRRPRVRRPRQSFFYPRALATIRHCDELGCCARALIAHNQRADRHDYASFAIPHAHALREFRVPPGLDVPPHHRAVMIRTLGAAPLPPLPGPAKAHRGHNVTVTECVVFPRFSRGGLETPVGWCKKICTSPLSGM